MGKGNEIRLGSEIEVSASRQSDVWCTRATKLRVNHLTMRYHLQFHAASHRNRKKLHHQQKQTARSQALATTPSQLIPEHHECTQNQAGFQYRNTDGDYLPTRAA
jgi:hypothetical protein